MGPEISGTDALVVLALWGGVVVVLTAPGWLALALAAGRRRAARGPGSSWPAAVAAALLGLLVCAVVVPAVADRVSGAAGTGLGLLAGWGACWLVALLTLRRSRRGGRVRSGYPSPDGRGWVR